MKKKKRHSVKKKSPRNTFMNTMVDLLLDTSVVRHTVNQKIVGSFMPQKLNRPLPLSTYSNRRPPKKYDKHFFEPEKWKVEEYISWNSLTDKNFFNRLLSCTSVEYIKSLPPVHEVKKIMLRDKAPMKVSEDTSLLFMSFAQWFTDGIFVSDPKDIRKCQSSHHVDLCQIYGLDNETTNILREGVDGLLKSQIRETLSSKGEYIEKEFLPYLFEYDSHSDDYVVKKEFLGLPYLDQLEKFYQHQWKNKSRKAKMYATGIFRGNMTLGHSAINTFFLRAHNKIARTLKSAYRTWDDDRLFETARNINIRIFLKILVEDYIEHLDYTNLDLELETGFAEDANWYRENWVSIEFNLLYRWHAMIPESIRINNKDYDTYSDFHLNNALLETYDVGGIFTDLTFQRAGKIVSLWNVPDFMDRVEELSIKTGRALRLRPYNDYREAFGLDRIQSFEDFSDNVEVQNSLKKLYKDVDQVEFYIGLFADDKLRDSARASRLREIFSDGSTPVLGELMNKMVAYEAFSQILTNPLLSRNLDKRLAFTPEGIEKINEIEKLTDLIKWVEGERFNVAFHGLW